MKNDHLPWFCEPRWSLLIMCLFRDFFLSIKYATSAISWAFFFVLRYHFKRWPLTCSVSFVKLNSLSYFTEWIISLVCVCLFLFFIDLHLLRPFWIFMSAVLKWINAKKSLRFITPFLRKVKQFLLEASLPFTMEFHCIWLTSKTAATLHTICSIMSHTLNHSFSLMSSSLVSVSASFILFHIDFYDRSVTHHSSDMLPIDLRSVWCHSRSTATCYPLNRPTRHPWFPYPLGMIFPPINTILVTACPLSC